ncbi:MAG: STAS domain-containing protein [Candidatus Omnitrophica bacterium]|nr:STAS domain-containing protein [Candidatus Omnitrophota bacterium]
MDIKLEKINDIRLIVLDGDLCVESTHKFKDTFKTILKEKNAKVLIDFAKVPFIDSSGIAALIEVCQNLVKVNGRLCLCHVNKKIINVFEITKVHKLFKIFESHQEALRSL